MSKVLNATYKFLLTILFIYSLFYVFTKNKKDMPYFLGLISASYVLSRTIFFSLNGYFETRYLATSIPFMELLVVLCMFEKFKKKGLTILLKQYSSATIKKGKIGWIYFGENTGPVIAIK